MEREDVTDETKDPILEAGTPEAEAYLARVEAFADTLGERMEKVLEAFEKEHHLSLRVFVDLIRGGLESLRHYIEAPEEKEVSWENPWTELHYAAEWDWDGGCPLFHRANLPETVLEALRKGENPMKLKEVGELGASIIGEALYPWTLHMLTHEVAVHVKDGAEVELLFADPKVKEELDALPSNEERDARLASLREPFSIGGLKVEAEDGEPYILTALDHPEAQPGTLPEWAEEVERRRKELPELHFWGEAAGVPYQGAVVLMIHPLVVDEDKREAYFPIVVGLVFAPVGAVPDEKLDEVETAVDPSSWSEEEKAALWKMLIEDIPSDLLKKGETAAATVGVEGQESAAEVGRVAVTAEERTFIVPPENRTVMVPPENRVFLVPAGPPAPERRYLLDAPTRMDRKAAAVLAHVGGVNLPRKWKSVKKWEDLVQEEVERLQDTFGDEAFGELLEKRTSPKGETIIRLTTKAQDALLESRGYQGFRRIVRDVDGVNREYIIKRFRSGDGYTEVLLTWYGQAWPLVDEGREKAKQDLERLREEASMGLLFEELDEKVQKEIDSRLRLMESIRDAREVMAAILHKFGAVGENPLRVSSWELRTLLECEKDPHGFRRVLGCLRALQEVRFRFRVAGVLGMSQDTFGSFLGTITYIPRGGEPQSWEAILESKGGHREGDFLLSIADEFVGCLKVFQNPLPTIKNLRRLLTTYDWGHKLSREEKKALGAGYIKGISSVVPYFDRAKGFTETQSRLRAWIEDNLTRKKHGARPGHRTVQVKAGPEAEEPRTYGRDFCPLLPAERLFHGALGHFPGKTAERGRRLFGTPTTPTKTSGGHTAGLLSEMGYTLPPGAAGAKRAEIAQKALQDLRAVVEEAFGGVVAGRHGEHWVSLTDAEKLPVDTLLKKVSWYLFLAQDWRERIPQAVEDYYAERHARGETPYKVKVTKDRALTEREGVESGLPTAVGLAWESLNVRLYIARKERKLSQAAVGILFGVSQKTVDYWEKGPERGEDGKVRGKPIPADVAPLILRWVEEGTPPTADELATLAVRRKVRPGTRKPQHH
jgi:hypothetical protein